MAQYLKFKISSADKKYMQVIYLFILVVKYVYLIAFPLKVELKIQFYLGCQFK